MRGRAGARARPSFAELIWPSRGSARHLQLLISWASGYPALPALLKPKSGFGRTDSFAAVGEKTPQHANGQLAQQEKGETQEDEIGSVIDPQPERYLHHTVPDCRGCIHRFCSALLP